MQESNKVWYQEEKKKKYSFSKLSVWATLRFSQNTLSVSITSWPVNHDPEMHLSWDAALFRMIALLWLWKYKHHEFTVSKFQTLSLNSLLSNMILHRPHSCSGTVLLLVLMIWIHAAAESSCPVCTFPLCSAPYISIRRHVDGCIFFFFFFLPLWLAGDFSWLIFLAESGLKSHWSLLYTHQY